MTIDYLKNIANNCPQGKALLGLDVGKKTIGLSLSCPNHSLATPLQTIKRVKFSKDMLFLSQVAQDYEVGGYIIGLPVNMDGTEGRRVQSIKDFTMEMERSIGNDVWIAYWDERLSTVSADNIVDNLVEKRKTKINAKASGLIDKLAAQTILQSALDYMKHN
ncbi:MAG: Holliday junction resolvase RuvX [Bdellovibrionales bacterium]